MSESLASYARSVTPKPHDRPQPLPRIAVSFGPGYVVGTRIVLIEKGISSFPLRAKIPTKLARSAIHRSVAYRAGEVGAILVNQNT
jgi:hypothetical protein